MKRFVGIFAVVFALALTTWASTQKVLWNFGGGSDGRVDVTRVASCEGPHDDDDLS